jgi:large subunit ribosomal protein L22
MAEARAHIKYIRISAIKLRTILDWVKDMQPHIALDYLSVNQNRTAKVLYKAIKSAIDNGVTNHGMDRQSMKFKTLMVDQGPGLKRFRAGARGTAKPYVRPLSHITVVLETDRSTPKTKKAKQLPEKVAEKTEELTMKAEEPKKVEKAEKATKKVRSKQKKA